LTEAKPKPKLQPLPLTEFFFPFPLFSNFFTALLIMTKIYPQLRLTSLILTYRF